MKQGTVLAVDLGAKEPHGLIDTSAEYLFFLVSSGQIIVDGPDDPVFSGKATIIIGGKTRGLKDPEPGDIVMFDVEVGPNGPFVCRWGFRSHFDRAVAMIAARPPAPKQAPKLRYRLMVQYHMVGDKKPEEPKQVWEGADLHSSTLRQHYDPKFDRLSFGGDDFSATRQFQQSSNDGKTWDDCAPPQ